MKVAWTIRYDAAGENETFELVPDESYVPCF
jgi:hypothetical protein